MDAQTAFCPVCGVALDNPGARTCKVCGADVRAGLEAEAIEEAEFRGQADSFSSAEAVIDAPDFRVESSQPTVATGEEVPFALSVIDREDLSALAEQPPAHATLGDEVRGYISAGGTAGLGIITRNWQKGGWVVVSNAKLGDDIWTLVLRYDPESARAQSRRLVAIMLAIGATIVIAVLGLVVSVVLLGGG